MKYLFILTLGAFLLVLTPSSYAQTVGERVACKKHKNHLNENLPLAQSTWKYVLDHKDEWSPQMYNQLDTVARSLFVIRDLSKGFSIRSAADREALFNAKINTINSDLAFERITATLLTPKKMIPTCALSYGPWYITYVTLKDGQFLYAMKDIYAFLKTKSLTDKTAEDLLVRLKVSFPNVL